MCRVHHLRCDWVSHIIHDACYTSSANTHTPLSCHCGDRQVPTSYSLCSICSWHDLTWWTIHDHSIPAMSFFLETLGVCSAASTARQWSLARTGESSHSGTRLRIRHENSRDQVFKIWGDHWRVQWNTINQ